MRYLNRELGCDALQSGTVRRNILPLSGKLIGLISYLLHGIICHNINTKHELEYESERTNICGLISILYNATLYSTQVLYNTRLGRDTSNLLYLYLHFYIGIYLDKELVYICFSNNLFGFHPMMTACSRNK